MAIKLTKNELKKQKDNLKQFQRYLPTLQELTKGAGHGYQTYKE